MKKTVEFNTRFNLGDIVYGIEHNVAVKAKIICINYSKQTIKEFKKGLAILKKAYIYAQRIDWLLSDDDGEESFHKRLKEELDNLKNKKNEVSKT